MTAPGCAITSSARVDRFLADGGYDGKGVWDCAIAAFGSEVDVIIPPPRNAVPEDSSQRNRHVAQIAKRGRMGWQVAICFNQRARVEAWI